MEFTCILLLFLCCYENAVVVYSLRISPMTAQCELRFSLANSLFSFHTRAAFLSDLSIVQSLPLH